MRALFVTLLFATCVPHNIGVLRQTRILIPLVIAQDRLRHSDAGCCPFNDHIAAHLADTPTRALEVTRKSAI
jgi:hypothetical protein